MHFFLFRFFCPGSQRNVSTSDEIECGVLNVDFDEHNKLSMKKELFCVALPTCRIVSSAYGFLERTINPNRALSRAPSARVGN